MNYRKGDVVSVQGVVEYDVDSDDMLFVKVPGYHSSVSLISDCWERAKITMVQPMFEVGEIVVWDNDSGAILAIAENHAWITYGAGSYCTRLLSSIKRAPNTSKDDVV